MKPKPEYGWLVISKLRGGGFESVEVEDGAYMNPELAREIAQAAARLHPSRVWFIAKCELVGEGED